MEKSRQTSAHQFSGNGLIYTNTMYTKLLCMSYICHAGHTHIVHMKLKGLCDLGSFKPCQKERKQSITVCGARVSADKILLLFFKIGQS